MSQPSQPVVVKNSFGWYKFVAPNIQWFVLKKNLSHFLALFCVKVQENEGQKLFFSFRV